MMQLKHSLCRMSSFRGYIHSRALFGRKDMQHYSSKHIVCLLKV